ncbi:hypothetical protein OH687_10980 [Burkholderia anthina]|nr:hypothetical protein OH687_10980 [Burkholderia anthina]
MAQIAQWLASRLPYRGMSMDRCACGFSIGMRDVRTLFVVLPMRSILVCDGHMTFLEPDAKLIGYNAVAIIFSCFTCT